MKRNYQTWKQSLSAFLLCPPLKIDRLNNLDIGLTKSSQSQDYISKHKFSHRTNIFTDQNWIHFRISVDILFKLHNTLVCPHRNFTVLFWNVTNMSDKFDKYEVCSSVAGKWESWLAKVTEPAISMISQQVGRKQASNFYHLIWVTNMTNMSDKYDEYKWKIWQIWGVKVTEPAISMISQ